MERQVVKQKRKGVFWIAVSFLICPCHLPFTLTLGLSLLGGSAMGVMLREHLVLAGVVVTLVWGGGTWYGFRKLRTATCSVPVKRSSSMLK
ncbi:hypothetical protein D3C72_1390150 [compost metagenome]